MPYKNFTQSVLFAVQRKTRFKQKDFQERGFHPNQISNWRTGKNEPSASALKYFVECMDCDYFEICRELEQHEFN